MGRFISGLLGVAGALLLCLPLTLAKGTKGEQEYLYFGTFVSADYEQLLLAHHVGNRPDDAPDIDDTVHGGDYDPGDTWDPNGDHPPEPGRPDNDPEDNG